MWSKAQKCVYIFNVSIVIAPIQSLQNVLQNDLPTDVVPNQGPTNERVLRADQFSIMKEIMMTDNDWLNISAMWQHLGDSGVDVRSYGDHLLLHHLLHFWRTTLCLGCWHCSSLTTLHIIILLYILLYIPQAWAWCTLILTTQPTEQWNIAFLPFVQTEIGIPKTLF